MGRLRREVVNKLLSLYEEGFTQIEIAKQLGISRSTVSKYVQKESEEAPEPPRGPPLPVLETLAKGILDLLVCLDVSIYLDENDLSDIIHEQALRLMENIATVDEKFAAKLLNNNPFLEHLRETPVLNLSIPGNSLSEEEQGQRKKWIGLIKKMSPQVLGNLVT